MEGGMNYLAVIAAIVGLGGAPAPAAAPVDVMVLGTWHFANPGRDLNNVKSDDVLKPQRQRELAATIEALAAFRPTKIMIEAVPKTPEMVDARFAAFTPETLKKERNESIQIGYRLAHRLKLGKVYAIDEQAGPGEPDYFPFDKLMGFAQAHGELGKIEPVMAKGAANTKEFEEKQTRMAIAQLLAEINDPRGWQSRISGYYEVLGVGDGEQQPGADLNAMWYLRNAKIFAKLMKLAEPGDRILVVYGAGHNYWLRHFAAETPGFRSVDPIPYLRKAAN
jgi:hypothetical protein